MNRRRPPGWLPDRAEFFAGRALTKVAFAFCVLRAAHDHSWRNKLSTQLDLPKIANRILKQVPQLYLFGLEIFLVVRVGLGSNRDLLHHLQAITF
jgi:hypothetical protein